MKNHNLSILKVSILTVSLLLLTFTHANAQSNISRAELSVEFKKLSAKAQSSGSSSEQLTAAFNATEQILNDLQALENDLSEFNKLGSTAVSNDDVLTAELTKLKTAYPVPNARVSSAAVKIRLAQYQAERQSILSNLSTMKADISEMVKRSGDISDDLVAARQAAKATDSTNTQNKGDGLLEEAKYLFASATDAKNKLRVEKLEKELITLPTRQALLEERIKVEDERLAVIGNSIKLIQSELRKADLRDYRVLASNIKEQMEDATGTPEADELTNNLEFTSDLIELTESYYLQDSQIIGLESQINEIEKSLRLLERIIAAGRADGDLGTVLRRIRSELPSLLKLKKDAQQIQSKQIKLQLNEILWQDALDTIAISELQAEQTVSSKNIAERQLILASLIETAGRLDTSLTNRLVKLEVLQTKSRELRRGLDGRLLWLPTNQILNSSWISQTFNALSTFFDLDSWRNVSMSIFTGLKTHPLSSFVLILIALILLAFRKRLTIKLQELSKSVGNVSEDNHWITPLAFLVSAAIAVVFPLLLWIAGWSLNDSGDDFLNAISLAFLGTSDVWFILSFFLVLSSPKGVVESHYGWADDARKMLASNLAWLMAVIVPSTFIFVYAMTMGDSESQYGLGRSIFLVISIALATAGSRILRPGHHVVERMFSQFRTNFTQYFLLVLFAVTPLVLGVLTLVGYFDTSVILQSKLFFSGLLVLSAALLFGFLHRASKISERRDAWARAKARRKARLEKLAQEGNDGSESSDNPPNFEEEEFAKIDEISRETNTVIWLSVIATVLVGLYFIWKSVLPALDIAESVVLWQGVKVIDGVVTSQPVSLGSLIAALIFIIGGCFLASNLRGILALGISEKIKLRPGTEYAATTIASYVLVSAGFVLGLSQLGLDWSKLQWIVAAMGVGLGFGLQEIVANFVSGLIILFERPIRVGDVVTIGNLDGTVSEISIRATTITDFEKRSVLIPNRKIITDNVTNWTLNDSVTRLLIKIGVGYETDITLARELMVKVVTSHPNVLEEPEPSVYFVNHGNSTLDFELRAYVSEISQRLITQHEINEGINAALTGAGINIAYPQQDVHIKSFVETTKGEGSIEIDHGKVS